jgi:hypothetical protein
MRCATHIFFATATALAISTLLVMPLIRRDHGWLSARLWAARSCRTATRIHRPPRLLVWRSEILSRAMERRRIWPLLDADADWTALELRVDHNQALAQVSAARLMMHANGRPTARNGGFSLQAGEQPLTCKSKPKS